MSSDATLPWQPGAATSVGSLPGEDPLEACRLVFGELPELPHLPELPARGPGADLVGRSCGLLVDLHVDLQPSGWRIVGRGGVDERRARDLLARDLDALEETAQGYQGPLKLQSAGPWTLAAAVELTRGDKVLADRGAVRDLAESIGEGLRLHLEDVRRRVPGARLLLQLDEPSLPAVLAGGVRTASGFGALRPVETADATELLKTVLQAAGDDSSVFPVVHCCAAQPPLRLMADAGARALSVDAAMLTGRDDDTIGELVEHGHSLLLGVVPSLGPGVPPSPREVVEPVRQLWRRLGFDPEVLAATVVPTPSCGLAGASEGWVRTALRLLRQVGRVLVEAPEAGG